MRRSRKERPRRPVPCEPSPIVDAVAGYLTANRIASTNLIYAALSFAPKRVSAAMRRMFDAHLIKRTFLSREENDVVELDRKGWDYARQRGLVRPRDICLTSQTMREFHHALGVASAIQAIKIGHAEAGVRFVSQGEIEARFGVANVSLPFQLKGKAGEKLPDGAFVSTYARGSIAYVLEYETLAKPVRRSSLEQNSFLKTALQYESVARLQPYQRGNSASPLAFPELMYLVVAERQSRVDKMLDVLEQENRKRTHFPLYKRMVFAVMPEKPRGVRYPTWYPDLFNAAWQGPNGRTFNLATGMAEE